MHRIDIRNTELAATQHGLVTLDQALMAGLGRQQIKRRVASGRWQSAGRAVYRMAGAPLSWQQRALAACLAAPDGAVVSHLTAAALAGLDVAPPPKPHLTVGRGRSARLPGVVIHSARLTVTHITHFDDIPATRTGRTLIDCAGILGPNRLRRMVDDALHRKLVRADELPSLWDHARLRPGRNGEVRLRAAVEPWTGPVMAGSPAEVRLRRQVVEWGYPEPQLQVPIVAEDGTIIALVDLGWPDRLVGIEYDSLEFHGPSRWAGDEQRHAAIERLGWQLLHADRLDLQPGSRSLRSALDGAWRSSTASITGRAQVPAPGYA